nr:MAG TPA: hypothetical protein [Caudoviricetes sp.]
MFLNYGRKRSKYWKINEQKPPTQGGFCALCII